MFRQLLTDVRKAKELSPGFFRFSVLVLVLYAMQMVLRIEITPLGYFSLYSNQMSEQQAYTQILPQQSDSLPLNIYAGAGDQFLMLEILPTRYQILVHSDHCNQMNHKLERIGLKDNNCCDCDKLASFNQWFKVYAHRAGLDSTGLQLREYGFKKGKIVNIHEIH